MKKTAPKNAIVLRPKAPKKECCGVVKLSKDAEMLLRRLSAQTGLSIRTIVSEIIVQSEKFIYIGSPQWADEDDEEDED